MSSNVFKQAEKEIRSLREAAEAIASGDLRDVKRLRTFAAAIKGTTAVEEAMTQLGGIQRLVDDKKRELAALEADVAVQTEKIQATESQCVSMRSQASAKAEAVLSRAAADANARAAEIITEAAKVAEDARAAALSINDAAAAARTHVDSVLADAQAEASRIVAAALDQAKAESAAESQRAADEIAASRKVAEADLASIAAEVAAKALERDALQAKIKQLTAIMGS